MQNISASIRIGNDVCELVVAESAPAVDVSSFEGAVGDERNGGSVGILGDGDIIDEDFTFFMETENELLPSVVVADHAR